MATLHGTRKMYREARCRCPECRQWNADQKRAYDLRVKERDGISVTQKYRPGRQLKRPGRCTKCSVEILALVAEPMCSKCRGDRPGRNIRISPAGRLAIYVRDGWVCQICAGPVAPSAPANSPWDATLDHIVPRSKGGADDPENLRLAHRRCNAVRGNRPHSRAA